MSSEHVLAANPSPPASLVKIPFPGAPRNNEQLHIHISSYNPVHHSRMKHIQIDLHFVCDLVQKVTLTVQHVHTQDELANLLTKPLSRQRTEVLKSKIGLIDGSPIWWGCIEETCTNPA
ncbi:hypothetical protein SADUNF_Sadunf11G0050100 [Salix dunnii]|uniref:Uncharacterized protein n=1 Tax=Salix dunnii TaxID=1413687 RepID=A0A835JQ00_9ROSI|nr:hypothetical protein SADUNF_Sadunf11G0050100 [Salix dunnii]